MNRKKITLPLLMLACLVVLAAFPAGAKEPAKVTTPPATKGTTPPASKKALTTAPEIRSIMVDPFQLLSGNLNLEYEQVISKDMSFFAGGNYKTSKQNYFEIQNIGATAGVKRYINPMVRDFIGESTFSKNAFGKNTPGQGAWVGAGAGIASWKFKQSLDLGSFGFPTGTSSTLSAEASGTLLSLYGLAGYKWVATNRVCVQGAIGLGDTFGKIEFTSGSATLPSIAQTGIGLMGNLQVGYSF